MGVEWFRSLTWDEAARAEFEVRLARARVHNRQQYLRIKGESLRAAGHLDAARDLLERAADHPGGYLFESVAAWETLADMAAARPDRETAERLYRHILSVQPSLSGTTGCVEISLAEVLLDGVTAHGLDEVSGLLDRWIERPELKFDNQLFRWHLALIRFGEACGDRERARRAAARALTLAERSPQLCGHPDVGLVDAYSSTLERLRTLAKHGRVR